jgi:hypothetical protein
MISAAIMKYTKGMMFSINIATLFRIALTETFMLLILTFLTDNFRRNAKIIKKIGTTRTDQWISIKPIKYDANMRTNNPKVVTMGKITEIEYDLTIFSSNKR